MHRFRNTGLASVILVGLLGLVIFDSIPHFDADLVKLKRQHDSPQRNWNVFYSQENVYQNSSIRYARDLNAIADLIEPNSIVLSDRASSYYVAAETRAFVKNIHSHHGAWREPKWTRFLRHQNACFPENFERLGRFTDFVKKQKPYTKRNKKLIFNYIMVNSDKSNKNLTIDCLSARHGTLNKEYSELLPLVFGGEYLTLYSLAEIDYRPAL